MTRPIQTDRLEPGHLVQLAWKACDGTDREDTFRVGERGADSKTVPPTVATDWLGPLMGQGVGAKAELSMPECNVAEHTITAIKLPPEEDAVLVTPTKRLGYWHPDHPLQQQRRQASA